MSSNSIFSSLLSEKIWLTEMSSTFPKENAVRLDLDVPPLVFRVPNELSGTKPEAYAPQKVGLGPYHHLRPDLYLMERKKIDAAMKLLNDEQLQNVQLVVEYLVQWVAYVRVCYDHYLDFEPSTLAWILTVDALYLLHFLKSYRQRSLDDAAQIAEMKKLAGDILMLENQIPAGFLLDVRGILNLGTVARGDNVLSGHVEFFCRQVSPLELNLMPDDVTDVMRHGHLLSVMYHLIMTNRELPEEFRRAYESSGAVSSGAGLLGAAGVPGAAFVQQQLALMEKVPWDRILALFKTRNPDEENPLMVEEIDIPSVSQLSEIAGIKFQLTQGGIKNVKFDEEEKKFSLPVITLDSNSEVILRNLLAYEAASVKQGSTLELAEYVDLMCGILDAPKDVQILRDAEIINGDLTDAEIATIFNGIRKSTGDKEKETTNIEKAVEKVNERYGNIRRVKVYRFIKKHVPTMGKFVQGFTVILLLALFVFQAFCQIYGCEKRWFKK